jgi:hypothetical protein
LIERLVVTSERFRELCDDLAASDSAFAAVETMPGMPGEARRAECREWIESLSMEIQEALRCAKEDSTSDRSTSDAN